jgi:hypothetical protein
MNAGSTLILFPAIVSEVVGTVAHATFVCKSSPPECSPGGELGFLPSFV